MSVRILRSGIHRGEEPVIYGNECSGLVVFSGCHLRCSFCYTPETSVWKLGRVDSAQAFANRVRGLARLGARNLGLISPTHVWRAIESPLMALKQELTATGEFPVVLKTSGYELPELALRIAAVGDVLVPDFKVWSAPAASSVSLPRDYGLVAQAAIRSWVRSHGESRCSGEKIIHGMVIRHLLMPGFEQDSEQVVDAIGQTGFRGTVNFMTRFIQPGGKLVLANPSRVNALEDRARRWGLQPIVDGGESSKQGVAV